jgi:hypothetical protein
MVNLSTPPIEPGDRIADTTDGHLTNWKTTLGLAGCTRKDVLAVAGDPELARVWVEYLHFLSSRAPWGEEYHRHARRNRWTWVDPSARDIRMRRTEGEGDQVEFRLRLPCEFAESRFYGPSHRDDICPDCWRPCTTLDLAAAVELTAFVRVRIESTDGEYIRVAVQRRERPAPPSAHTEEEWSETWEIQVNGTHDGWAAVNPYVRMATTGYYGGYLVQRAVTIGPKTDWSTASYVPRPGNSWTTLVPGIEFMEKGRYSSEILVRQAQSYQPELVTEPHWGDRQSASLTGSDATCCRNIAIRAARHPRTGSMMDGYVQLAFTSDPYFDPRVHPSCGQYQGWSVPLDLSSHEYWVQIAPNVRLRRTGAHNSSFYVEFAGEPTVAPPTYQPPFGVALDDGWTYLGAGRVRIRYHQDYVQIETLHPDYTWTAHNYHSLPPTSTEPIPGVLLLNATRRRHGPWREVAVNVQYAVEGSTDDSWGPSFLVPLPDSGSDQVVPGLRVSSRGAGIPHLEIWRPNPGATGVGIGSTRSGGWTSTEATASEGGWLEVNLPAGPLAAVQLRISPDFNDTFEVRTTLR